MSLYDDSVVDDDEEAGEKGKVIQKGAGGMVGEVCEVAGVGDDDNYDQVGAGGDVACGAPWKEVCVKVEPGLLEGDTSNEVDMEEDQSNA